jgi:hypothetical protein
LWKMNRITSIPKYKKLSCVHEIIKPLVFLMEYSTKIRVFREESLCLWANSSPLFEETYYFYTHGQAFLEVWTLKEKEIAILRHFKSCCPKDTASDPRRLKSSTTSPSEIQNLNRVQWNTILTRQ